MIWHKSIFIVIHKAHFNFITGSKWKSTVCQNLYQAWNGYLVIHKGIISSILNWKPGSYSCRSAVSNSNSSTNELLVSCFWCLWGFTTEIWQQHQWADNIEIMASGVNKFESSGSLLTWRTIWNRGPVLTSISLMFS